MRKKGQEQQSFDKIRFSIRFKLIIIISVIVLVSLGSITALVSWLVREDLKISAEENNFEVNRRAAVETEQALQTMRAFSLMFIRMTAAQDEQSAQTEADFFFTQNPQIAALFYMDRQGQGQIIVNERFFLSRGIDAALARSFHDDNARSLERAASGQTTLINASPFFNLSLAAMFFPMEGMGGCVLFSPENLNESFGMGVNASYLTNADGDVIADADPDTVKAAVNLADREYIQRIFNSPDRNKQMLVDIDIQKTAGNLFNVPALDAIEHGIRTALAGISDFFRMVGNFIFRYLDIDKEIKGRTDENTTRYYLAYTRLNTAGCIVITSIEYDKVFEGIAATTRRNIYLTATVLCMSVMLIWFYAKSISSPLKALTAAAHAIEGGSFNLDLNPQSHDEIGVLTSSFAKMCGALGIFGKFTNRDIALQAMRGQIKPGGLPKHATIFFSDIRGFTEKSENFTKAFGDDASDRIVHWLNEYFHHMIKCVEDTGGTVDKFIGDAVMAHWGTASTAGSPRADAFNCVKSALMMRDALYKMNQGRKQENWGNPPIRIGCGINTGVVTAGQIGSDLRMEYTVIGDPVNLASRVEALNKPLGTDILITEDTWNLLESELIVEEMPSVTVKGKEKPVRLFAVVGIVSVSEGPQTLAGVRELLGIEPPDIAKADVNAEEHKYKIGGE